MLRALRQPSVPPTEVRRILVVHQLLLGDTLLLAPLLKELARLYPDAERVVTVRRSVLPLFQGRPYGVVPLVFERRDSNSQRDVMNSGPYDLALVPDDNRYAWLARAAGARWVIGFANDSPSWKNRMLNQAVPYPQHPSAWADLLVTAFLRTTAVPFEKGEWPVPSLDEPFEATPAYAVLHVGASSRLKAWDSERWNQVAAKLRASGLEIVFSGAASENAWLAGIDATPRELRHFGKLDLARLWHLFSGARVLVCPDTGIAHMARLAGVSTIALFGPGSALLHGAGEFWKKAPYTAVTIEDFPCRNQTRLYRREVSWVRRCGRGFGQGPGRCPDPLCMRALPAETVIKHLLV
jgi:ADP-heptose:LPS heptosyltransferase